MFSLFLLIGLLFSSIPYSIAQSSFEIVVKGSGEESFHRSWDKPFQKWQGGAVDTVVIGGGLGGLTSAVYLTDAEQKVLLLEKEADFGGLAAGKTNQDGISFDRGAAYFSRAYDEELAILKRIGLADYELKYKIHEPIDSYLWQGASYPGIWEREDTMQKLPAAFSLFKYELERMDKRKAIYNQPIEEGRNLKLDQLSAQDWVKSMPATIAARKDKVAKAIYRRYVLEQAKSPKGMNDVLDFLTLYTRSALGATPDKISGLAFANFYISEIEPRYTSTLGTGVAANKMLEILTENRKASKEVCATVVEVVQHQNQESCAVETRFVLGEATKAGCSYRNPAGYFVCSRYGVFAAQLKSAPKILKGLSTQKREQASLMSQMEYAHYSVHVAFTDGHPLRHSYDTWVRSRDYADTDYTDIILGRWMDPKIEGYKRNPPDSFGIISIYHPLPPREVQGKPQGYSEEVAKSYAQRATEKMLRDFAPLAVSPIKVTRVETNRWPFSVHVPAPGFFSYQAKILRKPYGRILFAHSNLGTPAFEEALFRGRCAAINILKHAGKIKARPANSRCPLEKISTFSSP